MAAHGDRRGPGELSEDEAEASAARLRELAQQAARARKPNPTELRPLLEAAAEGDQSARTRLFDANLEMVIRMAAARAERGLGIEDLVQEGSIGLVAAIAGNDPAKAPEFEQAVAAAMETALTEEAAAKAEEARLVEDAQTYERAQLVVARLLGRVPTDRDMAEKLEWTLERTTAMSAMVAEARRKHDEELLQYVDPAALHRDDVEDEEDQDA